MTAEIDWSAMSEDLLSIDLDGDDISRRSRMTLPELDLGLRRGWVRPSEGIRLVDQAIREDQRMRPEVFELTAADEWNFAEKVSRLVPTPTEESDRSALSIWTYLFMAWLYDNRDRFADVLRIVELLAADLEFPPEISGMVRWMPPPEGEEVGIDALMRHWERYVASRREVYSAPERMLDAPRRTFPA